MAKLYFRYGTMGSGKTRDLIKTIYNYNNRNMNVLVIKPQVDTKGGSNIISRDGTMLNTNYVVAKEDNIYNYVNNLCKEISCVLVDEAQFLQPHHVEELSDVVDYLNIPVICYGLRADFQTHLFPGSKRLFELADSIEEIKTVCRCNKKATMNTRIIDGKYVFSGKQVMIDNSLSVTYDSLCRKCYKEEKELCIKKKKKRCK